METQIDSVLTAIFKASDNPGAVFLVAIDGKPVYREAYGQTNIELDVTMIPENVFQMGSMTKQFTAAAIMKLQEQGKLNVNDAISKYIPDYPNGNNITIHHLLTHKSGIKDFANWHLKDMDGIPTREHGGIIFGFKSMGAYVPSLNISVVGFSNCDCNSLTLVTRDIT